MPGVNPGETTDAGRGGLPRLLVISAWVSFLANVIIIGTGGAVRLTGSGLGCSEWPLCTPDSLVPTAELGIHGLIEFGNRTLTGLLVVAALAVLFTTLAHFGGKAAVRNALGYAIYAVIAGVAFFASAALVGLPGFSFFNAILLTVVGIAAVRSMSLVKMRRDLVVLSWIVLIGVVMQAFVGGITVLTKLNPAIVGFHYVSSLILACIAAVFLVRMRQPALPRELQVPKAYAILTHITTLAMAVLIFVGVLTTAAGPHSGDANIERNGFDASLLAHLHSWPGYVTFALVLVLVIWAAMKKLPTLGWGLTLLAIMVVQIAVGVYQARNGLPPLFVGVHMVLAALAASAMTVFVLRLKRAVTGEVAATA